MSSSLPDPKTLIRNGHGVFHVPGKPQTPYWVGEIRDIQKDLAADKKRLAAYDRLQDKGSWTGDDIDTIRTSASDAEEFIELLREIERLDKAGHYGEAYGSKLWFG